MPENILVIIIIIAIVLLVFYRQKYVYRDGFDYQCGKCGGIFSLSAGTALLAPNLMDKNLELKKLVRCPHCGQWTLATHLPKQ